MSTFIERLQQEKNELHTRMVKLGKFLGTEQFAELSDLQMELLQKQHDAMKEYYGCLNMRLADLDQQAL